MTADYWCHTCEAVVSAPLTFEGLYHKAQTAYGIRHHSVELYVGQKPGLTWGLSRRTE